MPRHLLPSLLLTLLLAVPLQFAQARVYQWIDPVSGRTQLSGTPPAWYRSDRPGPRVFVIEKGKLIDDTAVAVTEERRRLLRREAFAAARKQEQQQSRSQELARLRSALQKRRIDLETAREELARLTQEKEGSQAPTPEPDREQEGESPAATEGTAAAPPPADDEQAIAQLKALIAAWERQRTEQARKTLESDEGTAETDATAVPATPAPEEGQAP